jgi:2-polyprenyl-3-methyl-5-hydroxy-6-metoxy-1,4-benzoquinol methylase
VPCVLIAHQNAVMFVEMVEHVEDVQRLLTNNHLHVRLHCNAMIFISLLNRNVNHHNQSKKNKIMDIRLDDRCG